MSVFYELMRQKGVTHLRESSKPKMHCWKFLFNLDCQTEDPTCSLGV